MAYPLIAGEGSVYSWGTTSNFYVDLLAAMTTNSARWSIVGDMHDVTGTGALNIAKIPGLKTATATISGFGGNAAGAATPYVGNRGSLTFSSGYALHIQSWEWTARTTAVHDITSTTQTTPLLWRYFRPDIFTHSCRFTALVDSATGAGNAIVAPFDVGAAVSTVVLTYGSSQTITLSGYPRAVSVSIVKGTKQLVTYEIDGTSTVAISGGFLSGLGATDTWGNTADSFPLWTASTGGAAVGALIINNNAGGAGATKKVTFADSFWTSLSVSVSPSAPVGIQVGVQATGVVTIA